MEIAAAAVERDGRPARMHRGRSTAADAPGQVPPPARVRPAAGSRLFLAAAALQPPPPSLLPSPLQIPSRQPQQLPQSAPRSAGHQQPQLHPSRPRSPLPSRLAHRASWRNISPRSSIPPDLVPSLNPSSGIRSKAGDRASVPPREPASQAVARPAQALPLASSTRPAFPAPDTSSPTGPPPPASGRPPLPLLPPRPPAGPPPLVLHDAARYRLLALEGAGQDDYRHPVRHPVARGDRSFPPPPAPRLRRQRRAYHLLFCGWLSLVLLFGVCVCVCAAVVRVCVRLVGYDRPPVEGLLGRVDRAPGGHRRGDGPGQAQRPDGP